MGKRLIFHLGRVLLPWAIGIPIISFLGDPAQLYHHSYIYSVVANFVQGDSVLITSNYDDRLLQKEFILRSTEEKDLVILGSSRIMEVRGDWFGATGFQNHGVSGAGLEDIISIIQLYAEHKMIPNEVVIGVDPWIFNRNRHDPRCHSIYSSFLSGAELIDLQSLTWSTPPPLISKAYQELWSPKYFQEALISFFTEGGPPQIAQKAHDTIADVKIRTPENVLIYEEGYQQSGEPLVLLRAQQFLGKPYGISDMADGINEPRWQAFTQLISYLREQGCKISLILVPYHPYVFESLQKEPTYQFVSLLEERLYKLVEPMSIRVLGSYNPQNAGLSAVDFFDGMHAKGIALKEKIIAGETAEN